MDSHEALRQLADAAGIEARYWDIRGEQHEAAPDTMRALLEALGVAAATDADVASSLAVLADAPWRRALPPVIAAREGADIDLPVRLASSGGAIKWSISLETGETRTGEFNLQSLPVEDARSFGDIHLSLRRLNLASLPAGYHQLRLEGVDACATKLIVAPARCYLPPKFTNRRGFGVAAQLYALKQQDDWGIGDFGHLRALVEGASADGADAVGINPLHALFLDTPQNASPYSPCSRLFRNPLYLDVTAIADFAQSGEAQMLAASPQIASDLQIARDAELVDFPTVARIKIAVLECLYRSFAANHVAPATIRGEEIRNYAERGGTELNRFATFQALSEHFETHDWTRWPAHYRDHRFALTDELNGRLAERISFFKYLQWQCEMQMSAIADVARRGGMAVGLYNDLAVSIDAASADHWSHQDLFAGAARVGAPPDPFNESGQEWGVVPLNPLRLASDGFSHFSSLLRANMRHAGALRIDHVMGWQRLFMIPLGAKPAEGAYVRFPLDQILAVATLESQRSRCLLVGEDLGTVPAGFRERMADAGVLSCRVFYFEREHDRFRKPQEYPPLASVSVSTHDLATLRGFWNGDDIAAKADLGLFKFPEEETQAKGARMGERRMVLQALAEEGLLPPGASPQDAGTYDWTPALAEALHLYLARTKSLLFMAQIDDLAGVSHQANLPGSTTQYPNWRRRLPQTLGALLGDAQLRGAMAAIAAERAK